MSYEVHMSSVEPPTKQLVFIVTNQTSTEEMNKKLVEGWHVRDVHASHEQAAWLVVCQEVPRKK
jgi:hypothetical protein